VFQPGALHDRYPGASAAKPSVPPSVPSGGQGPEMPPARTSPVSRLAFEPGALDDQNLGASAAKPSVPSGGQGGLHGEPSSAVGISDEFVVASKLLEPTQRDVLEGDKGLTKLRLEQLRVEGVA
jgi:hypothetical protein